MKTLQARLENKERCVFDRKNIEFKNDEQVEKLKEWAKDRTGSYTLIIDLVDEDSGSVQDNYFVVEF